MGSRTESFAIPPQEQREQDFRGLPDSPGLLPVGSDCAIPTRCIHASVIQVPLLGLQLRLMTSDPTFLLRTCLPCHQEILLPCFLPPSPQIKWTIKGPSDRDCVDCGSFCDWSVCGSCTARRGCIYQTVEGEGLAGTGPSTTLWP